MIREIRQLISGVRSRQSQARGLEWLGRGAVVGSIAAVAIEIARQSGLQISPAIPWLTVGISSAIGWTAGWLVPIRWKATARAIDQHYSMKDSTATALEFAERGTDDPLVKLQLAETIACLKRVQPVAVIPLRSPKLLPVAVALCAVLLSLNLIPPRTETQPLVDTALQQVVLEQANALDRTMVEELKELAEQSAEPDLQDLVEEIEQLVEDLKKPDADEREVLAKISEMQQSLSAALDKFNAEKTDSELKELAAALESAQSMQSISEALKEGKYEKAAAELEKIDASSMTRKEKDAVAENLKKFREKLGAGKEGELSESAQEMQEGLEKENESQCKSGACKAAGVCKSQALKKSISNSLNLQLNRLSECKGACQSQCKAGGAPKKSEQESTKVGKAASNKPLGDEATKLDTKRREESITGIQGEGASERETSESPEGEQDASRSYQKRYSEFRKQMEEVLDSEPLPLGHRETVRKYFESIRPTAAEDADASDAQATGAVSTEADAE